MSEIADELSRRATTRYATDKAKEAAMRKSQEVRERVLESPTALAVIGGTVGAIVAGMVGRRVAGRIEDRRHYVKAREYSIGGERYASGPEARYGGYQGISSGRSGGGGVGQRVEQVKARAGEVGSELSARAEEAKEGLGARAEEARVRASEMAHRAGDRMRQVRERIPERSQLQARAQGGWQRAMDEQPLTVAAGALVLGAVAAMLLPVTRREHEAVSPLKDKASRKLESAMDELTHKVEDRLGEPGEEREGEGEWNPEEQRFRTAGELLTNRNEGGTPPEGPQPPGSIVH